MKSQVKRYDEVTEPYRQVLGSNQRRLSRRFYRPSLHSELKWADLRILR